ncbi:MAG: Arm DNA-binding domain-containing protein [Acidimicrobiia bacterium]
MSKPRGCVTRRGGSWVVIVSETDPETGKRRRRYHSGYRTKKEAEQARTEMLGRMDRGTYVRPMSLTVGQFLTERWLPAIESTVRLSTFRRYETDCRIYLLPRIGKLPLQSLQPDTLNRLYGKLQREGGWGGRSLSARTVRHCHRTIRKALQDALRWGYVTRNVADATQPSRRQRQAGDEGLERRRAAPLPGPRGRRPAPGHVAHLRLHRHAAGRSARAALGRR